MYLTFNNENIDQLKHRVRYYNGNIRIKLSTTIATYKYKNIKTLADGSKEAIVMPHRDNKTYLALLEYLIPTLTKYQYQTLVSKLRYSDNVSNSNDTEQHQSNTRATPNNTEQHRTTPEQHHNDDLTVTIDTTLAMGE